MIPTGSVIHDGVSIHNPNDKYSNQTKNIYYENFNKVNFDYKKLKSG